MRSSSSNSALEAFQSRSGCPGPSAEASEDSGGEEESRANGGGPGVICRPAENTFRKGLESLKSSQVLEARALFEAAIRIERESGTGDTQPRYVSYFGLTLASEPSRRTQALECCRRAVKQEFYNPDLFLNLSQVYMLLGKKRDAYRSATRGLALDPRHASLRQHLAEMGIRGRPALPFLDRSNILNIALGRIIRKGPRPRAHEEPASTSRRPRGQ